jgi:thiol-disulfide isomerase/thioredoxin
MPKRWEQELRRLGDVPAPTERIHARSARPSEPRQGDGMPPTRQRVLAGVVAFGVFIAAAAFGWQAFSGGRSPAQPGVANDWPVATVTLSSGEAGRSAVLSIGGRAQEGVFGTSTSPDEDYPYRWSNPPIDHAIAVPIGAELRLDGDVQIKEILFGNADELDAGRGPDSGPISSDQPTFEEPYFPVQDQPRHEYWKLFGTWADGSVLDVYFEVRWVEPRVDLSDTSVDIVVTPETLEADLLYGGQRRGTMGEGSYGDMTVTTVEWAGYDADTAYFPVAAGSTINVLGDDLESWTARIEDRQGPESVESLAGIPDALGPTTLRLSVVWGGGTGSFRFPIEIVEPASATGDVTEAASVPVLGWVPPRSFGGETLDARSLDPSDYQHAAIIAVAWATWCEPCRGTLTEIQDLTDVSKLAPSAVGIVERSDADRARRMVRDLDIAFPSVIAGDRDGWGIEAVPSVWVMAPDGTVVAERTGSVDRDWLADAVYEATFGEARAQDDLLALSDVLRVRCTDAGAEVLTPDVAARADGLHVEATPGSADHADAIELRPLGWPVLNFSSGSSGVEGVFVRAVPEGEVIVSCYREDDGGGRITPEPRDGEAIARVADPGDFYTPWIPACALEDQVAFDDGERFDLAGLAGDEAVRALISAVRQSDDVARGGYGDERFERSLFSVMRDGVVIGSVWIDSDAGGTRISSGFACAGSGIEEGFETYPAWEGQG